MTGWKIRGYQFSVYLKEGTVRRLRNLLGLLRRLSSADVNVLLCAYCDLTEAAIAEIRPQLARLDETQWTVLAQAWLDAAGLNSSGPLTAATQADADEWVRRLRRDDAGCGCGKTLSDLLEGPLARPVARLAAATMVNRLIAEMAAADNPPLAEVLRRLGLAPENRNPCQPDVGADEYSGSSPLAGG